MRLRLLLVSTALVATTSLAEQAAVNFHLDPMVGTGLDKSKLVTGAALKVDTTLLKFLGPVAPQIEFFGASAADRTYLDGRRGLRRRHRRAAAAVQRRAGLPLQPRHQAHRQPLGQPLDRRAPDLELGRLRARLRRGPGRRVLAARGALHRSLRQVQLPPAAPRRRSAPGRREPALAADVRHLLHHRRAADHAGRR